MAALFENVGNLGNYIPTLAGAKSKISTNLLLYLLGGLCIVVVVLMLMGVKINWSSLDPRPLSWKVTQAAPQCRA